MRRSGLVTSLTRQPSKQLHQFIAMAEYAKKYNFLRFTGLISLRAGNTKTKYQSELRSLTRKAKKQDVVLIIGVMLKRELAVRASGSVADAVFKDGWFE
jgi:hypothetical protein